MTFNFLPLPAYIIFCAFLCGIMVFFTITRRKKDRKGLIAFYITSSIAFPFIILGKVIPRYNKLMNIITGLIVIAMFLELTVIAIIDYKKGKQNKQTLIGLIMGWAGIIFFLLIMLKVI
jgi:ABC-type Mn2+/Zn2+ transport system permease subunit